MRSATTEVDIVSDGPGPSVGGAPAVVRAGAILRALAVARHALGISDIAAATGLAKSSVHAQMLALTHLRLAYRLPESGTFLLGSEILQLAASYLEYGGLVRKFEELSLQFADETGEACQLAALERTDVVYLAKTEGRRLVTLLPRIGSRLPASTTALGKAALSMLTDSEIRARYRARWATLPALTERSVSTVAELLGEVRGIRRTHLAIDNEQTALGLYCLAVPVLLVAGQSFAVSTSIPATADAPHRAPMLGKSLAALRDALVS